MLSNLTGWHFLIILVVVLLLFGAPKLPALARSIGQSMKILKTELKPAAEHDGATAGGPVSSDSEDEATRPGPDGPRAKS